MGGKLNIGAPTTTRLAATAASRRRRIDLDVVRKSPAGDIKLELFGDGETFDPDKGSYKSTGYVLIFGGWHNSLTVICRQEEHGGGRKAHAPTSR